MLIAAATVLLGGLAASAQGRFDASLWAGLNMCQIDGDNSAKYTHLGGHGGVQTSFALGKDEESDWRMIVELGVTQKGANKNNTSVKTDLLYVEIPIMVSYGFFDGKLRLGAGWAPAILARAKVTDAGVRDEVNEKGYRRMDWVPLCVDLTYFFAQHWGLNFRFNASMVSDMENPASGTYRISRKNKGVFNNFLSLNVGYRF